MVKSSINKYFDKIYVINLFDNVENWKRLNKLLLEQNIVSERLIGIDGRCKNISNEECKQKRKTFEILYNVTLTPHRNEKINAMVPASALTICHILLLRDMVKHNYEHILILEDDAMPLENINSIFKQGISELGDTRWDIMYLGCGGHCGNKDISFDPLPGYYENAMEHGYAKDPRDLRDVCGKNCKPIGEYMVKISKNIDRIGGTWAVAFSLRGAKKILKFLTNANTHIDQAHKVMIQAGILKAVAFDYPLVMHPDIRNGRITDIPW
jgi:hypothetical protein